MLHLYSKTILLQNVAKYCWSSVALYSHHGAGAWKRESMGFLLIENIVYMVHVEILGSLEKYLLVF